MEKQKDIKYYLHLFKDKKWLVLIPAAIVTVFGLFIALLLPSVYESSSTILIEEQQIPPDFVRTTVTGFADQRIQSITQQILSRTRLWETIKQFDLYKDLQGKYTQEEIIEKMRENITLQTISADMTEKGKKGAKGREGLTIAFNISYRGDNPGKVQKVSGHLASLYLEQNLKDRQEKAETTTKFLEAELQGLDERIKVIGDQIAKFKQAHEGTLPELKAHNLAQAERLENEIKQLEQQIRAAQDRKAYLEGQIATVNPDLPIAGQEATMDPKARLYMLQVALSTLQSRVSQDHPDVKKIKREIAELEKVVSAQGGQASVRRQKLTQLRAELAKKGNLSPEHPDIKRLQKEIARLEAERDAAPMASLPQVRDPNNPAYIGLQSQIQAVDNEIAMRLRQQGEMQQKLRMYRQRLEETPKIESEYAALLRDYQNAQNKHMEVNNKLLTSRIAEGMEEHQKAEKFTLIDPASFPEKPVSPNRLLIAVAGLLLGLAVGVGLVLVTDHMDHSIKDADELVWITDLPVLGSISQIQAPEVAQQLKKRRYMIAAATCLSILFILVLVHFLYKDLWVLTAQLLRLLNKYS